MVWRILRSERLKTVFLAGAILATMAGLLRWPEEALDAARKGLELCGNVLLPSLFPFFVLAQLVVELGLAQRLGRAMEPVMRPLFRVPGCGAAAVALGAVGGYPVGAKTAIALYRQGRCSKTEAQRLLAFCNNSGPAFILGAVGAGIFESGRVGLMLYLCHILASLAVGLLFRFYGGEETAAEEGGRGEDAPKKFAAAFPSAVTGAMASVLNISAFVLFFTVFTRLLDLWGIPKALAAPLNKVLAPLMDLMGLPTSAVEELLVGLLEMTGGIRGLTGGSLPARAVLAAFMLGWAGLSVHAQVLSFLADSDLSPRTYFLGKFLHGGFSAALVYLASRFFPLEAPVSAFLAQQAARLARADFSATLRVCAATACGIFLIFFFFAFWTGKRRETMLK